MHSLLLPARNVCAYLMFRLMGDPRVLTPFLLTVKASQAKVAEVNKGVAHELRNL